MPTGRWRRLDARASGRGYALRSITLFRLRVSTRAACASAAWSNAPSATNAGSASDARLHTAISSRAEYCTISVHRLDERIVPRFCWFDFALHASL